MWISLEKENGWSEDKEEAREKKETITMLRMFQNHHTFFCWIAKISTETTVYQARGNWEMWSVKHLGQDTLWKPTHLYLESVNTWKTSLSFSPWRKNKGGLQFSKYPEESRGYFSSVYAATALIPMPNISLMFQSSWTSVLQGSLKFPIHQMFERLAPQGEAYCTNSTHSPCCSGT